MKTKTCRVCGCKAKIGNYCLRHHPKIIAAHKKQREQELLITKTRYVTVENTYFVGQWVLDHVDDPQALFGRMCDVRMLGQKVDAKITITPRKQ